MFEHGLTRGRWQMLRVTITNPPDGPALRGEVQVAVEDARSGGARRETYTRSLSLPRGANRAEVPVTVRLPGEWAPDLTVYVANGRQIVAEKKLDRLPILPERLSVLAVADAPDALAYLRRFSLRENAERGRLLGGSGESAAVAAVAPALLPERSAGYDAVRIVYLGDFAPDALSDAQIQALRGWVAGGGRLVVGGARLLEGDERLRSWLPARIDAGRPPAVAADGVTVRALVPAPGARRVPAGRFGFVEGRVGRGVVVALGVDAAETAFAAWPGAAAFWQDVAARGAASGPGLIRGLEDSDNAWPAGEFFASVLRAPNLRAPAFGWIGLFLLAYLVLLVPVNYAVLRRLDRREWTWLTVPALVLIFSLGAYGFGYAVKGGRTRLNTATITELGPGDGRGALLASAGLFSPGRSSYDVAVAHGDALLFGPNLAGRGGTDSAPLQIREESDGVRAPDADVPMWAMRVFGARAATGDWGEGLHVRLARRPGGSVAGMLENRTGRDLDDVVVHADDKTRRLGRLPAGAKTTVRLGRNDPGVFRRGGLWQLFVNENGDAPRTTRAAIRQNLRTAVNNLQSIRQANGALRAPAPVVVTGWNDKPLLPLRVNGRAVPEGDHVNLVVVYAPLSP